MHPVELHWEIASFPPVHNQEALHYANRYDIPYKLSRKIVRSANQWKVPLPIAFKLVDVESRFDSTAASDSSSALGLTQVTKGAAKACHVPYDSLVVADQGLNAGFCYLAKMHKRYGNWWKAAVAYHDGPAVADTLTEEFHFYADRLAP